jgi:hypothetical protein
VVYADDFTLRILGGKTMVVVFFIIILLLFALFIFILPYIIIAGILAIPIYVAYYCINKYANRSEYFDTETDTLGPVETLVVDRLLERLARYDLSKAEIELLFGKEWRNELSRLDYAPADLFYKIAQMKIDLISPRNPFRKKVSHIIDKVIRIIDSVWIEYPQEVTQFKKICNDQTPGGSDWIEREWEFFKKHKKSRSEYSDNTFDASEAYEILGLSMTVTLDQVKERFRELALRWHPDKNDSAIKKECEKKFVRINQAYETIMGAA